VFAVTASFLEIYNEEIKDLLHFGGGSTAREQHQKKLEIRERNNGACVRFARRCLF
jgi:hypothetical protein